MTLGKPVIAMISVDATYSKVTAKSTTASYYLRHKDGLKLVDGPEIAVITALATADTLGRSLCHADSSL